MNELRRSVGTGLLSLCVLVLGTYALYLLADNFISPDVKPFILEGTKFFTICLLMVVGVRAITRTISSLLPAPSWDRIEVKKNLMHALPEIQKMATHPIGIVLAGGGAKGAYQVGVWRALHDLGIRRYSAFAGTSVGALNAALMAQQDIQRGEKIWADISFKTVMKTDAATFFIGAAMRMMLLPFYALQRKPFMAILRDPNWINVTLASALTGSSMAIAIGLNSPEASTAFFMLFFGFLLVVAAVSWCWWLCYRVHSDLADKFALSSNSPLIELARDTLSPDKIRTTPVYVTLTEERWIFRPPPWSVGRTVVGGIPTYDKNKPQFLFSRTPRYQNLADCVDDAELRRYVIQSAALPEIFPRQRLADQPAVDGGLADNVPILPLLQQTTVENIVVIYLGPRPSWRSEIRRIKGLARLLALQITDQRAREVIAATERLGTEWMPTLRSAPPLKRRLLRISPSVYLGGLVFGTMNFTRRKANKLIRLGYWDALCALERNHWEAIDLAQWNVASSMHWRDED